MATQRIDGLRVAIVATDGVEQVELVKPRQALEQAGAQPDALMIGQFAQARQSSAAAGAPARQGATR